jgi:hypothetical protein
MSEGWINFLKTGKWGRVGYEVRQRVNECAPQKKRSHATPLSSNRSPWAAYSRALSQSRTHNSLCRSLWAAGALLNKHSPSVGSSLGAAISQ